MRRMLSDTAASSSRGQASAELVAVLPALLVCFLIAAQIALAGWALWSAGVASRAGARADHVGRDGVEAARRALPGVLREHAEVDEGPPLRAQVRIPSVVPGLPSLSVSAATSLDGDDGG